MKLRVVLCVVLAGLLPLGAGAEDLNLDSLKVLVSKVQMVNPAQFDNLNKIKKNAQKGNLEAITKLGNECLTGANVTADIQLGLSLLEMAGNQDYVEAQYDLGRYYFIFWGQKPTSRNFYSSSTKWLRLAQRNGSSDATPLLARLYFEYGKYTGEEQFVNMATTLLKSIEGINDVNDQDDNILSAQAHLGTINLHLWRTTKNVEALKEAKRYYKTLLKSKKEYPNYTAYIDSLALVLSQGVEMSIGEKVEVDPNAQPQGGFGGGFPGMGGGFPGFGGGFPGMGAQTAVAEEPQGPQPEFPGGRAALSNFVRSNTNYVQGLADRKLSGRVQIGVTIGTDGAVINPIPLGENNHLMEQEAMRTIMVMPDWIPAMEDGVPVQSTVSVPVSFSPNGMMGGMGGMMF